VGTIRGSWRLSGARELRGCQMKSYSIVRMGDDYVVQAEEKSVLKVASRRRAAQLVNDAAELLNAQPQSAGDAEPPSIEQDEVS
jgi:hypothetical protein